MATKKIKVLPGQSIWDIAAQYYGSASGVQQLFFDNPPVLNFNDSLVAGTELIISGEPINKIMVDFFEALAIKPGTATEVDDEISGVMQLENADYLVAEAGDFLLLE